MADSIDTMLALSDEDLQKKLGVDKKVATFKENLERASKLSGKSRKMVTDSLDRMLNPTIYPEDLTYTVERAERAADPKKRDDSPSSCLCGVVGDD